MPADETRVLYEHLAWFFKILFNLVPYQLPCMDLQSWDVEAA